MPQPPRKKSWSRPLADFVGKVIDPVLAKQGFSESDLILHWDDIVGEQQAAKSRPIKLQWPPRPPGRHPDMPPQPATLVVRVEGGIALELQHRADQVLARINAHLGWRCVGRLAFRQGPIERLDFSSSRRSGPTPAELQDVTRRLVNIEHGGLRDALSRLGAHVLKKRSP